MMGDKPLWTRLAAFTIMAGALSVALNPSGWAGLTARGILPPIVSSLVIGSALALVSTALPWPGSPRALALAGLVYVVTFLNSGLELAFFSTYGTARIVAHFARGLVVAGVLGALAAGLFSPPGPLMRGGPSAVRRWLARRSRKSWLWRFPACALVYVVLYFLAGAVAFRFVQPFYTDPSYGLELVLPSGPGLLVRLQFVRGLIFALALVPLLAGSRLSRRRTALLAGWALFALGALGPLIGVTSWPLMMRVVHTVEMFFQNFLAGAAAAWLLTSGTTEPIRSLNASGQQLASSEG